MSEKEIDNRFPLTDMLLQMWKYDYYTKWVRFVYHETRKRDSLGIPCWID